MGGTGSGLHVKVALEEEQSFAISRNQLALGEPVSPLPARPPRCQSIKKIIKLEKVIKSG